jgi:hypothetical protein
MSKNFIAVLKSLSAPTRADFMFAALQSGHFEVQELFDLFGGSCVDATLRLALEYIDVGSILVLPSRREPYLRLIEQFAALSDLPETLPVELRGKHP